MPNQLEVNCYFKSEDLAKLCEHTQDVLVKISVSYPPEAPPVFEIRAQGLNGSKKESLGAHALHPTLPPPVDGCPTPCK